MTAGLDVLVQEVIAATVISPSLRLKLPCSVVTATDFFSLPFSISAKRVWNFALDSERAIRS